MSLINGTRQLRWHHKCYSSALVLALVGFMWSNRAMGSDVGLFRSADQHSVWLGMNVHPFWFLLLIALMMWSVALGVGLFYHRILTHKVCEPNRWLAYFFVTIGAPAGTPIQWVGNHRYHHQVADTDRDPHSPSAKGFWVAHAGWYLGTEKRWLCVLYSLGGPLRMIFDAFWRPRTNQAHVDRARDIARDPYYAWLSRPAPYAFVVLGHVVVTWLFVFWCWGLSGCAILYVVQLSYYVIGHTVNSTMHMFGERPFESGDKSTNVKSLVFLTSGEAYHNTHHALPSSANLGLLAGQFDLNYFWIRLFARLGLAKHIRLPAKSLVLSKTKSRTDREYIERHYLEPLSSGKLSSERIN